MRKVASSILAECKAFSGAGNHAPAQPLHSACYKLMLEYGRRDVPYQARAADLEVNSLTLEPIGLRKLIRSTHRRTSSLLSQDLGVKHVV